MEGTKDEFFLLKSYFPDIFLFHILIKDTKL